MRLNELIDAFAEKVGGDFTVEDGMVMLGIDDMSVTIQELDEVGRIATYAEIGEPPPERLEKLYEAMLAANHLFAGTAGSTISFDTESRRFYLCRTDVADVMDADGFMAMLEKFVNTLEIWRKLLADYRSDGAQAAEKPAAEDAPFSGSFSADFLRA